MITKYTKYNESIKSLLVGPTKEELEKNLKNMFLSNKIKLDDYFNKCKEYGLDGPTEEEILKYLEHNPEKILKYLLINKKYELLKKIDLNKIPSIDLYYISMKYGFAEGVKISIKNGYRLGNISMFLDDALKTNNLEIIKIALDKGVKITSGWSGNLGYISHNSSYDVIKYLLDNNYIKKSDYEYIFVRLCEDGKLDLIKLFLNKRVDIHHQDDISLYYAVERGHTDVVKLLIDNGANVNQKERDLLYTTIVNNELKISKEINNKIVNFGKNMNLEIVRLLLDNGVKITPRSVNTVLMNNNNEIRILISNRQKEEIRLKEEQKKLEQEKEIKESPKKIKKWYNFMKK